jgi:hypothetical protein
MSKKKEKKEKPITRTVNLEPLTHAKLRAWGALRDLKIREALEKIVLDEVMKDPHIKKKFGGDGL